MGDVHEVRFAARVPAIDKEKGTIASVHVLPVVFKTGKGPCGKYVERLTVSVHPHCISIIQFCVGGEVKEFVYLTSDVVGRVQMLIREGDTYD